MLFHSINVHLPTYININQPIITKHQPLPSSIHNNLTLHHIIPQLSILSILNSTDQMLLVINSMVKNQEQH